MDDIFAGRRTAYATRNHETFRPCADILYVSAAPPLADFHDLWIKYAPDVYRFSLFLSGEPATAQDLTSEAFLRLWTARDRVQWPTVKSYLFTIARNVYLQQDRRTRRESPLDDALPAGYSVAQAAETREQLQLALDGIRRLPEIDRAALLLRVEEGLSYEEIAAILELPVSTAKVKVHRARLRLAEILERKSTT